MPILPEKWQYIIPDEKKQQFDILRSLMERPDVTGLVCATDAGREGELIFRFVYQMAGCKKPFKRLWISSMEDSAIKDGFAHLKPGTDYDPLYQSALCRAKADWLVGINATRLFSVLYHKTLTVGRVQTPTLNLLVERDAKMTLFIPRRWIARPRWRTSTAHSTLTIRQISRDIPFLCPTWWCCIREAKIRPITVTALVFSRCRSFYGKIPCVPPSCPRSRTKT